MYKISANDKNCLKTVWLLLNIHLKSFTRVYVMKPDTCSTKEEEKRENNRVKRR